MILHVTTQGNIRCLLLIFSCYNFVNGINVVDVPSESEPTLKVFKIMNTNDKLWLQKENLQGYNPQYMKRFLKDNADLEIRMKNFHRQFKPAHYPRGAHKVLVKRIVPHDKDTPDLEYDRKNNKFFRPLIRYHMTKEVGVDDDKTELNKRDNYIVLNIPEDNRKFVNKLGNRHKNLEKLFHNKLQDRKRTDTDNALLHLFGLQLVKAKSDNVLRHASAAITLLKDIQVLSSISNPITKRNTFKQLKQILKQVYELYTQLRLSSKGYETVEIIADPYNRDVLKIGVIIDLLEKIQRLSARASFWKKEATSKKLLMIKHEVNDLFEQLLIASMGGKPVRSGVIASELVVEEEASSEVKAAKKKIVLQLPADHLYNYWTVSTLAVIVVRSYAWGSSDQ